MLQSFNSFFFYWGEKVSKRRFFEAKQWRKMTTNNIIQSIEVGLRVLKDRSLSKDDLLRLVLMLEEGISIVKAEIPKQKGKV